MAISVTCTCGERVTAHDYQAGQWAFCPSCGIPVPIPSSRPNRRGSLVQNPSGPGAPPPPNNPPDGPAMVRITPRPSVDRNRAAKSIWIPLDEEIKPTPEQKQHQAKKRRVRRRINWQLETYWFECLLYPFRAWPLVGCLGVSLAICLLVVVHSLPQLPEGPALPAGAIGVLLGAYAIGFLHCVLVSASAGEYRQIRWPSYDIVLVLRSCLTWMLSFLLGPIVYAGVACWYWLHAGDLEMLDVIILAELGSIAGASWLLAVLSAAEQDAIVAGPATVVALLQRLGYRGGLALLAGPTLVVFFPGRYVVAGLIESYASPAFGGMLTAGAGIISMFLATFYLRYLGLLVHRCRVLGMADEDRQEE